MKRKLALIIMLLGFFFVLNNDSEAQNWYRGNLHMHSYWSDGVAFPEEAISLYRDEGYQFVCLSDHNLAQNNPERFNEIKNRPSQELIERFQKRYPDYPLEIKEEDDKKFVRLKTFQELKKQLESPGEFLLIPGFELSGGAKNGVQVHMNLINTEEGRAFPSLETEHETMAKCLEYTTEIFKGRESSTFLMLDHPDWIYFDIDPGMIIDKKAFQFFEVINCGPVYAPHPNAWTTDKFWDVVNAFRAEKGNEPLYGIASDDTHDYVPFYQPAEKGELNGGGGWVMVRAQELTTEAIIQAMKAGDFYASTGVFLDDIQFNPETKTLSVKVKAEENVDYSISFIGTKKGFDQSVATVEDPAKDRKPARTLSVYSDEIGETFVTVQGTEATFKMSNDILYVRAKIVANKEPHRKIKGKPDRPTAWTQPIFAR
ncbi:MAG: hypothetical protein Q4C95_04595 [Planctomycetia bacterium]|nr:hypothetical protein [Planctomycetia bacterium]